MAEKKKIKKSRIKNPALRRFLLALRITLLVILLVVLIGGIAFYCLYGKELLAMQQEAKKAVAASTVEKDIKASVKATSNVEAAAAVGTAIAKKAAAKGIEEVVFDRGGFLYHGRVKALAEAAREAGLQF